MTARLAFVEMGLIGAAVCTAGFSGGEAAAGGVGAVLVAIARALGLSFCGVLAFYYQDLYDLRAVRSLRAYLSRLPRTGALALLFASALSCAMPWIVPPPDTLAPALAGAVALVLGFRILFYALRAVAASTAFERRTLVLGTGTLAVQIAEELGSRADAGEALVGLVDPRADGPATLAGVPVLGSIDELESIIARSAPDRIVVALEGGQGRLPVRRLIEARVRGILVEDGVDVFEGLAGKVAIESLPPTALVFARDFSRSRLHAPIARLMSVMAAAAGLVLGAPLMLLVAAAISLDSRGPIFFLQDRVGLGGRRFRLLKFRTMRPARGATSEWAGDNDARITRAGRWIRRFRLDELPQLVNVLQGHMNLIGPRPHPVSNYDLFLRTVPYYWIRAMVRPGITGWAQVRYGYADNLEQETEKMRFDLHYIKHRSVALDLRILLDTVQVVLFGGGVARSRPDAPEERAPRREATTRWEPALQRVPTPIDRRRAPRVVQRAILVLMLAGIAALIAATGSRLMGQVETIRNVLVHH
jgi:exopolysaccharide biosynthesis polyprenyl glycosylphosphotransferase